MSRRRLTVLAALIAASLAALAIVLISVGSDDGGGGQGTTTIRGKGPTAAQNGGPAPKSPKGGARRTDRSPSSAPSTSLSILDKGTPASGGPKKLAPAVNGGTLDLAKLQGSPVVLNVWSSDCIGCRGEARVLESEWERYGPRGVLFVGLNVQDSAAAAKGFRAEFGVTYTAVAEKGAQTARALGATGVPETFFFSKAGDIVDHVVGAVSLAQVEFGIRAAQTGHRLPTSRGGPREPLG